MIYLNIKKSSIWNDANDWTKTWTENNEWEIDNWYGIVDELSTDQGGDVLSLGVNSDYSGIQINYKTWNNRFSDSSDNTMPSRGSIIYNQSSELKVGDWVHVLIIGLNDKNEPPYQVESVEDDLYSVVQTEGSYQHRVKVPVEKLKKLRPDLKHDINE